MSEVKREGIGSGRLWVMVWTDERRTSIAVIILDGRRR